MLSLQSVQCPYCWQQFDIHVDCSQPQQQQYTEDCRVCCQPVLLKISLDEGNIKVVADKES